MDLPLCKICGERHRLGFCPDLDPVMNRIISQPCPSATVDPARPRADSDESRPPAPTQIIVDTPTAPARCENPVLSGQGPQAVAAIRSSGEPSPASAILQIPSMLPKPRFDKRGYQRALMRKRRAEGKA